LKYDSKKEIKCHNLCMVPIIWLNHEGYSLLSNSPLKLQTQKSPIVRPGSFVINDGGEGGIRTHLFRGFKSITYLLLQH
jgi:hypothetical protein